MKILIADDEKISQLAIKRVLEKEGYKVEVCGNAGKALEVIKKDKDIRIIIIGENLPDMNGIDLCKEIRDTKHSRYIYIIVNLTDNNNHYQSMKAGADDYISKPFDDDIFILRIKAGMRLLEAEDKLINSQKELIKLVKEDALTSLLNRRAFLDEAVKQIDRAYRENHPISAILLDIDAFNQVNESYGYFIGDRILTEFANRLRYGCRPYDIVGRYSGEEFIVLLPNTKASNAVKAAKRLRSAISKKYYDIQGYSIKLTACIGISYITPDIGLKDKQIDILTNKIEIALKKAKSQGIDKIALNAEE